MPRITLETMPDEDCNCRQKATQFVYTERYFLSHEKPEKCGTYLCLQRQGRLLTPWYRGVLLQVRAHARRTQKG